LNYEFVSTKGAQIKLELKRDVSYVGEELIDGGFGGTRPGYWHDSKSVTVYVDGKQAAWTSVHDIMRTASRITQNSARIADSIAPLTQYVEVGQVAIGVDDATAAEIMGVISTIGTMEPAEYTAHKAEKAAKMIAEEVMDLERTIKVAEQQDSIPGDKEYRAYRKWWNDVHNDGEEGYVPTMVTRERYEAAKERLAELSRDGQ
jgi:predicted nucleic acid-binding protein